MIENKALKTLEYDKILDMLSKLVQSKPAKHLARNLKPNTNLEEAKFLLDETAEADRILFEFAVSPSFSIDNIDNALGLAKKQAVLSIADIMKVGRTLATARRIDQAIQKCKDVPILAGMSNLLYIDKNLEDKISKSFLSDTEVCDNASNELRIVRQRIRRQNANIKSRLIGYTTSTQTSKLLSDSIVTMRGDRYVIPVKADCKGQIPGLIHDQSASGSTIFVEPMAIVELNNQLKSLLVEEQNEIEKILRGFSESIALIEGFLKMSSENIASMDLIFAKAQLAKKLNAIRPELNSNGWLKIDKGKHPLIDAKAVVPISIEIEKQTKMLLITGPNTGGKTVTLKLVGLFTAMALSGFFLPARNARIANFDAIYCDIGDEQSIEQSLSTFSSHIKNIINITNKMTPNSLLLFDELGAGTDPSEGAALAVSLSDSILKFGAKSVITSHFNDLKEYAIKTPNVATASMDFDENTFSPTYKLIMGSVGTSNALKIASKLGLRKEVVEEAEKLISSDKKDFLNVLSKAEETRRKAEQVVFEAEEDRLKAQQLLIEAEKERNQIKEKKEKLDLAMKRETKKLIENQVEEANDLIAEIKEILKKEQMQDGDVFVAQKLRKKLCNMSSEFEDDCIVQVAKDNTKPKVGDTVYVISLAKTGILQKINSRKNEGEIKLGKLCVVVKNNDYYKVKR